MKKKTAKDIFKGKETPKEEAAERRYAGSKKRYEELERKYEPGVHKDKGKKMAKGGGVESKGKTRGKMVKM
jgi:hypothetical protein